jgi:hypothetical protein
MGRQTRTTAPATEAGAAPAIETDTPAPTETETPAPAAQLPEGSIVLTPEGLAALTAQLTAQVTTQVLGAVQAQATPAAPPLPAHPAPTNEEIAAAEERDQQVKAMLKDRAHAERCPVTLTGAGRVEFYAATRPPDPRTATPAQPLTVLHCIECGATDTINGYPPEHGLA